MTAKLDFKSFNKTELAAKLLIISRSFELVRSELMESREVFDNWAQEICEKNFVLNSDSEVYGCTIYLQSFLLGVKDNKFDKILNS